MLDIKRDAEVKNIIIVNRIGETKTPNSKGFLKTIRKDFCSVASTSIFFVIDIHLNFKDEITLCHWDFSLV